MKAARKVGGLNVGMMVLVGRGRISRRGRVFVGAGLSERDAVGVDAARGRGSISRGGNAWNEAEEFLEELFSRAHASILGSGGTF